MRKADRVSIVDVARAAGVSSQTVSRVLNNQTPLRPETRARVLAAMEELHYRPNPAARALASRRSNVIGVVAVESPLYGPTQTLYAVERAARAAGFAVNVTAVSAREPGSSPDAVELLVRQGAAGIVVIAPLATQGRSTSALPDTVPLVVTQGARGRHVRAAVGQVAGAAAITRHLMERSGGVSPSHVAGPADWLEASQRERGWRTALVKGGLRPPPVLRGDWTAESGHAAALELVAREKQPRAVFFANDHMALGGMRAFRELGLRVPEDVLVAGFDDVPEAAFFSPPLTTVAQDFIALGEAAVKVLVGAINGAPVERVPLLPAHLVVRESTGRG